MHRKACAACAASALMQTPREELAGDVYLLFSAHEETDAVGGVAGEIISTAGTVLTGTVGMINGIVQLVQMSATSMTATATAATAVNSWRVLPT